MSFIDDYETPIMIFFFLTAIMVVIIGVFLAIAYANYSFNDIPVRAFVDGKEVYNGRNACINVKSGGYTTTLDIGKGYLCLFPGATYTGKDVIVKPISRQEEEVELIR